MRADKGKLVEDIAKQLVIIARALCSGADILLLDEPTSDLDLKNQGQVLELIRELSGKYNFSVIFSCLLFSSVILFAILLGLSYPVDTPISIFVILVFSGTILNFSESSFITLATSMKVKSLWQFCYKN